MSLQWCGVGALQFTVLHVWRGWPCSSAIWGYFILMPVIDASACIVESTLELLGLVRQRGGYICVHGLVNETSKTS
ncbi:hypothetical protein A8V01_24215 [Novosphingobium guangzhouense]|uniref:Uncharacterized protein n=1 Tax=Novosphingobium guangzhouense TaxID=1850347 RepID=A0A2K2FWR9_9SPHN|nr:hypothetical protein A8V01_24215 [Novosphingobium guangzhouense]